MVVVSIEKKRFTSKKKPNKKKKKLQIEVPSKRSDSRAGFSSAPAKDKEVPAWPGRCERVLRHCRNHAVGVHGLSSLLALKGAPVAPEMVSTVRKWSR